MTGVYDVATVRRAEESLMATLPDGALMQRAAHGLAEACMALLRDIEEPSIVLLVGSGNNGGDTLFAGAVLAARGHDVEAILLSGRVHEGGREALLAAGGRVSVTDSHSASAVAAADMVLDGIVGIGGAGALRPEAARLAAAARESGALIVAVDIPSGVNADTGAVADRAAVVNADVTVTFGCLKPGLLLSPGRGFSGAVVMVEIGLDETLPAASIHVIDDEAIGHWVPEPGLEDYKYSRGVAGLAAGSARYRGAALMATASARCGGAGMVHVLDRGDGIAQSVVDHFWDVVVSTAAPGSVDRVTAWAVGPGLGTEIADLATLVSVLHVDRPVVVDADGLRLLPKAVAELHRRRDLVTVLTPHDGEFAALGFSIGDGAAEDRLGAARHAARDLHAIVVLKGPGTVVATPAGSAYIDTRGGPELGTAGSGDVLTGLLCSLLAGGEARGDLADGDLADGDLADIEAAGRCVAAGVGIHGIAGSLAADGGRPVTALDVIDYLPEAVARVRRGMPT